MGKKCLIINPLSTSSNRALKKTQHLLLGAYTVDITISPATLGHFESPKQPNGVGTQRVIGTFRVFNLLEKGWYSPAGALQLPPHGASRAQKLTAAPPSVIF